MFGCSSCPLIWASSANRSISDPSPTRSGSRTLMATSRRMSLSKARMTTPDPPRPMTSRSTKRSVSSVAPVTRPPSMPSIERRVERRNGEPGVERDDARAHQGASGAHLPGRTLGVRGADLKVARTGALGRAADHDALLERRAADLALRAAKRRIARDGHAAAQADRQAPGGRRRRIDAADLARRAEGQPAGEASVRAGLDLPDAVVTRGTGVGGTRRGRRAPGPPQGQQDHGKNDLGAPHLRRTTSPRQGHRPAYALFGLGGNRRPSPGG